MGKRRIVVGLSATAMVLGTAFIAPPNAGADDGSGGDTKRVRMFDDCDPATFNAAIGPGTCVGDGETTFEDFIAQLIENGFEANESADDWEFKPEDFHIDHGDRIRVVNKGGEFHTFTEVAEFGGGCVEELNAIFGLDPVPECDDPDVFPTTGVPAGGTLVLRGLAPGEHYYECLIHPWMQSVVEVRHADH
jgi:plastocyanin